MLSSQQNPKYKQQKRLVEKNNQI